MSGQFLTCFLAAAALAWAAPVLAHPQAPAAASADEGTAASAPAVPVPAGGDYRTAIPDTDDWIRPEDVADRADSLLQRLEQRRAGATILAGVRKIDESITRLDPELQAALEQAKLALADHASLIAIQDARRELEGVSAPFRGWMDQLEEEAKRVAFVLDELDQAEARWARTLERPETKAAGEAIVRRVESSQELVEEAAVELRKWRVSILALNDRLLDRSASVKDSLEKLQDATLAEGAGMLIPDHPPLWKRDLVAQLARELPLVQRKFTDFNQSTVHYVIADARPFLLQVLAAFLLMFLMRGFPQGAQRRMARSDASPEALRLLQRPFAVAALLALILSPALHPAAPHRVIQFLGLVALFPVARVLMLANERSNVSLYAGLLVLLLVDRLSMALASLPALTLVIFLAVLSIALSLAFEYRRRLLAAGGPTWVTWLLAVAMGGLSLSLVAEISGWSSLASLLGRGILVSGTGALYVYAATISIEALFAYALASPALRKSRFIDRNQSMVQRWTATGLRVVAFVYWLRLLISSLGLRDIAVNALQFVLNAGISVGALSISIGGVLAFVMTLVVAMYFSRFVHEVLEDEIFPRTHLPRGIPHALMALTTYTIYSLGFLLALAAAGVQLGQLSILLGGLGVGIGLGLQDVVKNFAAGITILLERRVHVGDAVQIPDKNVFGRVLSIGMRASVVRNWNGTEVIMPNDDLVSGSVTNWTLSDASHRLEVAVGVAYGTDPETVIDLLLDVARSAPRLLATPPPAALFTGFGESSLDFVLRAWSDEGYETAAAQTSDLAVAVHRALREAGITVPFPQRDLHLATVSDAARAALGPATR